MYKHAWRLKMSSTNKTPHYDLSQFVAGDKASWMGDINPDMLKIDTALFSIKTDATDAASNASAAQQQSQSAVENAQLAQEEAERAITEVTKLQTSVSAIESDYTLLNTNVNQIKADLTSAESSITQLQTDVQQAQTSAEAAQQTSANNTGLLTLPSGILSAGAGLSAIPVVIPSKQGYQLIIPFRSNIRWNTGDSETTMELYTITMPQVDNLFVLLFNAYTKPNVINFQPIDPYNLRKVFGNYANPNTLATFTIGNTGKYGLITITLKVQPDEELLNTGIRLSGILMGIKSPLIFKDYTTGQNVPNPYPKGTVICA